MGAGTATTGPPLEAAPGHGWFVYGVVESGAGLPEGLTGVEGSPVRLVEHGGGKPLDEFIGNMSEKGSSGKVSGAVEGVKKAIGSGKDDDDDRPRRPAKKSSARRRSES